MKGITLLLVFRLVGAQEASAPRSLSDEQLDTFKQKVYNPYNVYNTNERKINRVRNSVKQAQKIFKHGGHIEYENNKVRKPYHKTHDRNIYENRVDMKIFTAKIPTDILSQMNEKEPHNNARLDFVNVKEDNYFDYISDEIVHRFYDYSNEYIGGSRDVQETSVKSQEDILESRINLEKLRQSVHDERNEFNGNENTNFEFALEEEEADSKKETNKYIIGKFRGQLGGEKGWENYEHQLEEEQETVKSRNYWRALVNGKDDLYGLSNEIESHVNEYEGDEKVYSWDLMESDKHNKIGKTYEAYNDEDNGKKKNDMNFGVLEYLANIELEGEEDHDDKNIYTDLDSSDLNMDYYPNDYLEDHFYED